MVIWFTMETPGNHLPEIKIEDREMRMLFNYLFVYSRGAPLRSRIVLMLRERPMNKNELSTRLRVNYRTVEHHLSVLIKNNVVEGDFRRYNSLFYLKDGVRMLVEDALDALRRIGGE
ncbi:MAG: winged helix-turn-helix domain-containing protein [Thermoplasmata archaeon]